MKISLERARLYGICDLGYLDPGVALSVSRQLLEGGVDVLQLRAKDYAAGDLVGLARELKQLCDDFQTPFIVNDHLELALEAGAQGLHLGQDDGDLAEARHALGDDRLLGRSTHSLDQARRGLAEGADYIGFGPLFPTPTKQGRPAIGLSEIKAMESEVGSRIPAFCIGGIHTGNLSEVISAGARRVVVVSHLLTSTDPVKTTTQIKQQLP